VYNRARQHFSNEELAQLTLAVITINGWNRIAISFRGEPGHYKPAKSAADRTSAA
jgi:alkylhydroperoxidase family enzyme